MFRRVGRDFDSASFHCVESWPSLAQTNHRPSTCRRLYYNQPLPSRTPLVSSSRWTSVAASAVWIPRLVGGVNSRPQYSRAFSCNFILDSLCFTHLFLDNQL
jgi:hypothetical protein